MPRRKKTNAEQARELLDQGVAPAEVSRRLGVSRQAVHAANKQRGGVGRPASDLVRLVIYVPPDVEAWIREQAESLECALGDVVAALVKKKQKREPRG